MSLVLPVVGGMGEAVSIQDLQDAWASNEETIVEQRLNKANSRRPGISRSLRLP